MYWSSILQEKKWIMLQFQHRATSPHKHFVSINYVWSIYQAGNVSYVNWKQNAANSWNGWFTMIWQCGADRSFYGLTSIRFPSCPMSKRTLPHLDQYVKDYPLYNEASYIHGILIYIMLSFVLHLRTLIMLHRIFISFNVPECKGDKYEMIKNKWLYRR